MSMTLEDYGAQPQQHAYVTGILSYSHLSRKLTPQECEEEKNRKNGRYAINPRYELNIVDPQIAPMSGDLTKLTGLEQFISKERFFKTHNTKAHTGIMCSLYNSSSQQVPPMFRQVMKNGQKHGVPIPPISGYDPVTKKPIYNEPISGKDDSIRLKVLAFVTCYKNKQSGKLAIAYDGVTLGDPDEDIQFYRPNRNNVSRMNDNPLGIVFNGDPSIVPTAPEAPAPAPAPVSDAPVSNPVAANDPFATAPVTPQVPVATPQAPAPQPQPQYAPQVPTEDPYAQQPLPPAALQQPQYAPAPAPAPVQAPVAPQAQPQYAQAPAVPQTPAVPPYDPTQVPPYNGQPAAAPVDPNAPIPAGRAPQGIRFNPNDVK